MYKYDRDRGGYYNDVNGIVAMGRYSAHGDYNNPLYEIELKHDGDKCTFYIYWYLMDNIAMDILRKNLGDNLTKINSHPIFLIIKNDLLQFSPKEKINFLYKCGIIKNSILENTDIDLLVGEIKIILEIVNHDFKCIILTRDSNLNERERSDIFCNIYISMHSKGLF